jgi:hypothetical protein
MKSIGFKTGMAYIEYVYFYPTLPNNLDIVCINLQLCDDNLDIVCINLHLCDDNLDIVCINLQLCGDTRHVTRVDMVDTVEKLYRSKMDTG